MHTLAGISATKTLEAVRKWINQNPVYLLGSIINQLERERRRERGAGITQRQYALLLLQVTYDIDREPAKTTVTKGYAWVMKSKLCTLRPPLVLVHTAVWLSLSLFIYIRSAQ
jgi:hypothetical protein